MSATQDESATVKATARFSGTAGAATDLLITEKRLGTSLGMASLHFVVVS